jgi:CRISPR-associated endonuclease/helicase Cas3
LGAPEGIRIHLCVYHSRFPLVQRSAIEHLLDGAFNRRGDGRHVYHLPSVRTALDDHSEQNHLFVVLASPVCEVGRDWDADWAVVEPSSMRSLIQLAGRVQRHRCARSDQANVLVFDTNLRHFRPGSSSDGQPVAIFVRPGFEKEGADVGHRFRLLAHRLDKLMSPEEYQVLTALPRIRPRPREAWQPDRHLVDLEQARISASMLPRATSAAASRTSGRPAIERDEAACAWQYPQATLTGMLPQQQPFREDPLPSTTLTLLPDEDEEHLILHRIEDDRNRRGRDLFIPAEGQRHAIALTPGPGIGPWGEFDLLALLAEQAEHLDRSLLRSAETMAVVEVPRSEQGWRYHPWLGFGRSK